MNLFELSAVATPVAAAMRRRVQSVAVYLSRQPVGFFRRFHLRPGIAHASGTVRGPSSACPETSRQSRRCRPSRLRWQRVPGSFSRRIQSTSTCESATSSSTTMCCASLGRCRAPRIPRLAPAILISPVCHRSVVCRIDNPRAIGREQGHLGIMQFHFPGDFTNEPHHRATGVTGDFRGARRCQHQP